MIVALEFELELELDGLVIYYQFAMQGGKCNRWELGVGSWELGENSELLIAIP